VNNIKKYVDLSDLFACIDDRSVVSVYDANGKCVIPDSYGYISVMKVDVPTKSPLLECLKKDGFYDYRYSSSCELFLSGRISVKAIDQQKGLYYLANKIDDKDDQNPLNDDLHCYDYYDIFGNSIFKGLWFKRWDDMRYGYDDNKGFYYKDEEYNKHYINKKIDETGHVVPVYNYSNSSWGWGNYDKQDIWIESEMDGGYDWDDFSGSNIGNGQDGIQQRQKRKCGLCDGTGEVIKSDGLTFGIGNTKYCEKCKKTVPASHYHTTCPSCNGQGWW
jgi:hypothetical protein